MTTSQELKGLIDTAFDGVTLKRGASLRQAREHDTFYSRNISQQEFHALRKQEITDNWRALPLEELDDYPHTAFLDAEGFRYYIPALMISVLRHYVPTSMRVISTLTSLYPKKELWDHTVDKYALLNNAQKSAIAAYLVALPQLIDLRPDDNAITQRAVRNFWGQFLPKSPPSADT